MCSPDLSLFDETLKSWGQELSPAVVAVWQGTCCHLHTVQIIFPFFRFLPEVALEAVSSSSETPIPWGFTCFVSDVFLSEGTYIQAHFTLSPQVPLAVF